MPELCKGHAAEPAGVLAVKEGDASPELVT